MASKWAHQIAVRFSINDTQANDYLYSVQRRCLPNVPRYPVVVDTIFRKGYATLPDPERLAQDVMGTLPAKVKKPHKDKRQKLPNKRKSYKSFGPPYLTRSEKRVLRHGIPNTVDSPSTATGREPGVASHTKFDEERVSPDKLGHCPHGVPDGEPCGICNPEEFKRMTGIE